MPTNNVLRLEEYRDRRSQRLRLQFSLSQADAGRAALLRHLRELTGLLGTDRAAVVWVDEYGPGLVHPHAVLDLASDRPRRSFALEPLRRAWDSGVPGVFHCGEESHALLDRTPWTLAVALGSDGSRAWFLVTDALSLQFTPAEDVRARVMFLAGECSAVVLHRDLDVTPGQRESREGGRPGFAGWPILKDIEGREDDDAESQRIALRFIVARLPRLLLEDDLAVPQERLREQAERARTEIGEQLNQSHGDEEGLWVRVLDAFQEGDLESLAARVVDLGRVAEVRGHSHGAAELYRTAYEIAGATGSALLAADAARSAGRALRRMAEWDEAKRWYGIARGVAEAAELDDRVAVILEGLANMQRDRGNIPAARVTLEEALRYAERSGSGHALGSVYHGLLSVEQAAGHFEKALAHGWRAARTYDSDENRVRALASLGGVLVEVGDLRAATDAWTVVSRMTREHYYRLYAFDALAYIAALRGDRKGFDDNAARADALDWMNGASSAKAEILLYRGLSYAALGELSQARDWLQRALAFAEEQKFSRLIFQADEALSALDGPSVVTPQAAPTSPTWVEIRSGLSALKNEWVTSAG